MAQKKTSMFTLTERITLSAVDTVTSATIDLGSYVDVGDRQALQIHSVDYIFQGDTGDATLASVLGVDASEIQVQVLDLNRGGLVFANDRALISSARFLWAGSHADREADLYPDNYGKGSDDGRYVVNDTLYLEAIVNDMVSPTSSCNVTVRVNCSIVTLTSKDFI